MKKIEDSRKKMLDRWSMLMIKSPQNPSSLNSFLEQGKALAHACSGEGTAKPRHDPQNKTVEVSYCLVSVLFQPFEPQQLRENKTLSHSREYEKFSLSSVSLPFPKRNPKIKNCDFWCLSVLYPFLPSLLLQKILYEIVCNVLYLLYLCKLISNPYKTEENVLVSCTLSYRKPLWYKEFGILKTVRRSKMRKNIFQDTFQDTKTIQDVLVSRNSSSKCLSVLKGVLTKTLQLQVVAKK